MCLWLTLTNVTISLSNELVKEVDKRAEAQHVKRSTFVANCVRDVVEGRAITGDRDIALAALQTRIRELETELTSSRLLFDERGRSLERVELEAERLNEMVQLYMQLLPAEAEEPAARPQLVTSQLTPATRYKQRLSPRDRSRTRDHATENSEGNVTRSSRLKEEGCQCFR